MSKMTLRPYVSLASSRRELAFRTIVFFEPKMALRASWGSLGPLSDALGRLSGPLGLLWGALGDILGDAIRGLSASSGVLLRAC